MRQKGLTIVELMITLAVLAILVGIAAPSFQDTIEQNRIRASLQDFSASVKYARSEAVKRSGSVSICASSDKATCTGAWGAGWIVFKDVDAEGDFDAGTDTLLRVGDGVSDGQALTFGSTFVSFNSRGYTTGQSGTFKLCGKLKKENQARGMILQATGSLRFASDSNGDGIYEDAAGSAFSC